MSPTSPDGIESDGGLVPHSAHTLSLLTARRPSFASPSGPLSSFHIPETSNSGTQDSDVFRTSIYQDDSPTRRPDFSRGLQIKMQGWVGDGVGKMSISPSGRDVVLAARSGLYIIDLETPLEVPRFLPQGGTWDVADVQWNPHPSRANYVVSTSSEKLIIWNLDRPDRAAIQFILSRHYRSITDLNWHNHNPDIVASTGIDSWIWMWDLRTAVRPVTGLCAFNPGATQVKWNRHDENILASSHGNTLLIWDQRKGAVPLTTIKAHTARIYGIDWSRRDKDEIVSCSLDQTIKFWNTSSSDAGVGDAIPRPLTDAPTHVPRKQIDTNYPVWRARHVPFGDGVLSLPQRGIRRPELFNQDGQRLVEIMTEGATGTSQADIVKEYVWRTKGGSDVDFDDREFQLVTWSQDRTLRAWPIDAGILEAAGFNQGAEIEDPSHRPATKYESYRLPQAASRRTEHMVSAPTGGRSILAGVRANSTVPFKQIESHEFSAASKRAKGAGSGTGTFRRGGTMTKGTDKSMRSGMHALAWMPSVTVGEKKESSGVDSMTSSRLSLDNPLSTSGSREGGSASPQPHPSVGSEAFDSDATPTWAEELTSVVNGLSSSKMAKVSLEKMELKKRTCTLGLQGPWGESSSVFVRVTFIFPRDYPRSLAPQGLPHIELEKNHLVPVKNRTFLLRELRELRKKPPCIESCLRFLLGLPNKKGVYGRSIDTDSGSSSGGEDVGDDDRPNRDPSVTMRGQTGLAEPRTSQGIFGPNGELVCFFHMPLRMMRAMDRSISLSPSTAPRAPRNKGHRSSGVLSDALRRLTAVAHDRQNTPPGVSTADEGLLRILESLAQPKISETPQSTEVLDSAFYLRPTRKSLVSIRDVSEFTGLDQAVAKEYAVTSSDAGTFCQYNAKIAHAYGRYDHERVFRILHALIGDTRRPTEMSAQEMFTTLQWHRNRMGREMILLIFDELVRNKDIQMLAMVSVALLSSERMAKTMRERAAPNLPNAMRRSTPVLRPDDYFSLPQTNQSRSRALSDASFASQTSLQSPTTPVPGGSSFSSSMSSRGSWSSILNASASGVRFLMSGQDGSSTPKAQNSPIERSRTLPAVSDIPERVEGFNAGPKSPEYADTKQTSPTHASQRQIGTPKSWSEPMAPPSHAPSRITVSFSSAGHADSHTTASSWPRPPRKHVLVGVRADFLEDERHMRKGELDAMGLRLVEHIVAYSGFLFRWDLLHKRAELLKCLTKEDITVNTREESDTEELAVAVALCRCGAEIESEVGSTCVSCKSKIRNPSCSVCRLPVTGLSHFCLVCGHSTHLRCWHSQKMRSCPTGCGCECQAWGSPAAAGQLAPLSPHSFLHVAPASNL